jgi:hypothetical protein
LWQNIFVESELEKMNKRRAPMEDGRRHIIFYTFGAENKDELNRRDAETPREKSKTKKK